MRRPQLEHVIGAAAFVSGEETFIVIGSQAILGSIEDPPAELLESMEADVYPAGAPEKADLIDGALGDGSPFHAQYGYFAHGVGPETAKPPAGWRERLVRVEVPARPGSKQAAVALCLERHDLVLAKLVRGDDRDWSYAETAIAHALVETDTLLERCASLPVARTKRVHIARQLRALRRSV
jgi:hypothetical protein